MKKKLLTVLSLCLGISIVSGMAVYADTAAAPSTLQATKTSSAPKIDGDLSDAAWADGFTQVTASDNPASSMQYKFVWDDSNLYLAVKMKDSTPYFRTDKLFNGDDGADTDHYIWDYDCCGLYFSPTNNREDNYAEQDFQFMFSYQDDGKPAFRVGGYSDNGCLQKENFANGKYSGVKYACSKNDGSGWNFELMIPWSGISVTPAAGKEFSYGVSLDDAQEDSSKNTGCSNGTACWNSFKNSDELQLADAPASSSTPASSSMPTTSSIPAVSSTPAASSTPPVSSVPASSSTPTVSSVPASSSTPASSNTLVVSSTPDLSSNAVSSSSEPTASVTGNEVLTSSSDETATESGSGSVNNVNTGDGTAVLPFAFAALAASACAVLLKKKE